MNDLCVCVLAHNEQKHIAKTISAIVKSYEDLACDIKIYANGCTDKTAEIVRRLARDMPNLFLRELDQASKPNTWNVAFTESRNPILIFSDGDVEPEPGAIKALWRLITREKPEIILAGCTLWPRKTGLSMGQRFTGFLQIPLKQDFLSGGLYAVARDALSLAFNNIGIDGIPLGIVAEDTFLELLVPRDKFFIIRQKVFYEPPEFTDYWKYLARVRWQEDQLSMEYGDLVAGRTDKKNGLGGRLTDKLTSRQPPARLLLGLAAAGLRSIVKAVFHGKINKCYRALGPVGREGRNILSQATRSRSAK